MKFLADAVREKYEGHDMSKWDFSLEGRIKQAQRMKFLSDGVSDFVCPTQKARDEFDADFTVWMDTIKEGRYEDTNKMFEKPDRYKRDYHVAKWFDDTHVQLVPIVERFMKTKHNTNRICGPENGER